MCPFTTASKSNSLCDTSVIAPSRTPAPVNIKLISAFDWFMLFCLFLTLALEAQVVNPYILLKPHNKQYSINVQLEQSLIVGAVVQFR